MNMAATYTVKQVAQILGYSTNSIYTFLKEKRIKGVRVGTGRFRIPQSELNRLLMIKKTDGSEQPTMQPSPPFEPVSIFPSEERGIVELHNIQSVTFPSFGQLQIGMPNIFDWFVGVAAIVAGLAMYLFNKSFDTIAFERFIPFVGVMQSIFVGCGIGIILSNTFGTYHNTWHKVFTFLLGIGGIALSILLWVSGDVDGALIYGSLVLVTLFVNIVGVGGVASMGIYITALGVVAILVPIIGVKDVHVLEFMSSIRLAPWVVSTVIACLSVIFSPLLWFGYVRRRRVFWFCMWIAAFSYFALSFWYASGQYWARSFFFMVMAISTAFTGPWEALIVSQSRRERMLVTVVLTAIGGLLVVGVIIVYLMQLNILSTIRRENEHKVQYAQLLTSSILQGVESTLAGVAQDTDLAAAVTAKDTDVMNDESQTIMNSNPNIRRVVIVNAKGQGLNLYPFGIFVQSDLSFRDYFIAARDAQQPFISDVYASVGDNTNRPVVSVSAPILGKNSSFVGVIVASLDLNTINANLQKIAVPERGEFLVIVDSKGKLVLGPDTSNIGMQISSNDPVILGAKGQHGTKDEVLDTGGRAVVAYGNVGMVGWGVGIKTPYVHIYELAPVADLFIFGVVLSTILCATILLQGIHIYRRRMIHRAQGDSP